MAQVPYNPTAEIAPGTDAPNGYLKATASPTDFGAQIGQAKEGLGRSIEQASNPAFEYAMKRQGQINEAAAVNGETQANEAYGKIFDELRSKKNFDAANSVNDAVAKATQVRQQLRQTMPNDAAAKAFDTLIARTEGFVIRDMHSYADGQLKAGHSAALTANRKMWVDRSASPEVAFNDAAWNENMSQMLASAAHELDNNGVVGDSDDAKAIRDEYVRQIKNEAWQKRIITIADDPVMGNVDTAVKTLEANKEDIPAEAYSALSRTLAGPYHAMQTRKIADDVGIRQLDDEWSQVNSAPATSSDVVSAFKTQEGVDFGIQPGTWKQYAQPGETFGKDNEAVATRILQKYAKDYNGDMGKVATAYFSGPGNVAPAGSATPYINNFKDKNGKTTASYVDDILRRTQGMALGGSPYYSKADYVQLNYDRLLKDAQHKADEQFPGHPELAYQAVQRTEQNLKAVMASQTIEDRRSLNNVYRYITDMDRKGTPLTTAYQVDNAEDPQVKSDWQRVQQQFPLQTRNLVDRMASANIRGKATTYGTAFWDHFQDVISGKTHDVLDLSHDLDNFKLTNTGMNQLKDLIDDQGTPDGKAFSNSMLDFFKKSHNQIVMNTPGISDEIGEAKFTEFMQAVLPEIAAKRKQGINSANLFTPDGKSFVGNNLHQYDRTLAQKVTDYNTQLRGMFLRSLNTQSSSFDPNSLKGLDPDKGIKAIFDAVNAGTLSKDEANKLAIQNNWAQ